MTANSKFLFETDFGDLETLESKAQRYSEEDLAAARQAAMQDARNEMRDFEEKRAADLLTDMAACLDEMSAARRQDLQTATESAVDIGVAMCRKVLPTLAAQNALAEIEGHIVRTLAEVFGEPRVVVRVSEDNVERLRPGIDNLASSFDGKIVLLADEQLAPTDCHVMWADGGCERDLERSWAQINKAVQQIVDGGLGNEPASAAAGAAHDSASDGDISSPDFNSLPKSSQAID